MNTIDPESLMVTSPSYETTPVCPGAPETSMRYLSSQQVPQSTCSVRLGWITSLPHPTDKPEEVLDEDRIIIFWGNDYEKPQVLGGVISMTIGGQSITFANTTGMYIPAGVPHGPLVWREFQKPHMIMSMTLGNGTLPGLSKVDTTGVIDYEKFVIRSPMREAGAELTAGRTAPTMTYMSGVQIPGVKTYIEFGWTFGMPRSERAKGAMPVMAHKGYDEIVLHVGGDPADPEDIGGDIEFGVDSVPLNFSKTSALYVPRGVPHGPII